MKYRHDVMVQYMVYSVTWCNKKMHYMTNVYTIVYIYI